MKTSRFFIAILALASLAILNSQLAIVRAATTIDSANKYAYSGNLGWLNWAGDSTNGTVIGEYVCSGYVYSANIGWINLGSGSPTNGIYYQNLSANDFGVNRDELGNLRGFAYSGNIGWINFENTGAPAVNLLTGQVSGYVWSANCGWISLSNSMAKVQTDTIQQGALAADGLPIAWLLANFGTTNVNAGADPTGKGMTIREDYLAGTNPNNANSVLRISGGAFANNGASATLSWESVPARYYSVQETTSLSSTAWKDSGLGLVAPSSGTNTTVNLTGTNAPQRFYRIQAVTPLIP
jgi:hypothetical protein